MSLILTELLAPGEKSTVIFKELKDQGVDEQGYDKAPIFLELGEGTITLEDGKRHCIYVFDPQNRWRDGLYIGYFEGQASGGYTGLWRDERLEPGQSRILYYGIGVEAR